VSIGSVLREQRLKMGLTVTEAARLGGVTRSYLSMVETGKRAPNPEALVGFTRRVNVPTDAWLPAFLADERRCPRLVGLGRALYQAGDYSAARSSLSRAFFVSRFGDGGRYNSEIYEFLGKVYYAQGRYSRALRWFKLLHNAVRHTANARLQAATSYNLAQCLAKVGQELEALSRFDEAIAGLAHLRLWFELGQAWLAKANVLLEERMYKEGHLAYRHAAHLLRGRAFHCDAMLGVAITHGILHGPKASEPLFRKIADDERVDDVVRAKARSNLATALRELGRYEQAVHQIKIGLTSRVSLPSSLLAAMLTEAAICSTRLGDSRSALHALQMYKGITGNRDGQDIAAMRILARVLGMDLPGEAVAVTYADEYDRHLTEALKVLQTQPMATSATEMTVEGASLTGGPHARCRSPN